MASITTSDRAFLLFGTSACHLCELAEEMLCAWRDNGLAVNWETVDIADSDELFERYGVSIPVLRHPDGQELYWPFEIEALGRFLAA